jgi:hypothetical protein
MSYELKKLKEYGAQVILGRLFLSLGGDEFVLVKGELGQSFGLDFRALMRLAQVVRMANS